MNLSSYMTNSFYHTKLDGCTTVQYTEVAPTDAAVIQITCTTFSVSRRLCSSVTAEEMNMKV